MAENEQNAEKNAASHPRRKMRTRLVAAGRAPADQYGFINTPIYRGSTVLFPDVASLLSNNQAYTYATKGTPTIRALENAWADFSGAEDAVLAPSGLAAIALALMCAAKAGDHILIVDSAYSPTRHFCDHFLRKFGVETEYYPPLIGAGVSALLRPNTSVILTESPGSLSFEIQDIPAIAKAAHAGGVCVIMDNTWATPLFFPPHERGVDLAVEAGTKYLSGHSDFLMGLVSANAQWARKLRETFNAFAMCAGPEDAFLGLRGLRTMELRLREAERNGLKLAQWFERRPEVSRVLHPALPNHPQHALFKRDFLGSSGLFSVILKPVAQKAVAAMIDGLELFGIGYSWGGYESLVIPFDCAPFRTATRWSPEGPALRFSVGLEDIEDLIDDLEKGFTRLCEWNA